MVLTLALVLARFGAGLFAGTCLYALAVAMPVRRRKPPASAHADFVASLARSERMQPPLHAVSLLAALAVALLRPATPVLVALVALAPILPLSLLAGRPIYNGLRAMSPDDPRVLPELDRFTRVHALRTALALLGFLWLAVPIDR